jgi:hypothetical protein
MGHLGVVGGHEAIQLGHRRSGPWPACEALVFDGEHGDVLGEVEELPGRVLVPRLPGALLRLPRPPFRLLSEERDQRATGQLDVAVAGGVTGGGDRSSWPGVP